MAKCESVEEVGNLDVIMELGKIVSLLQDYTCARCDGTGMCSACGGSGQV